MPEIRWLFGQNALGYIHSTAQIVALFGPPGSHKSFASIQAILAHQQRCGCSIHIAVIRDTLQNIGISVVRSFKEFFQDSPGEVHFWDENRKMRIDLKGGQVIEADLFGCNDENDVQRLQGASSWSLIWINDPAPQTDSANAGVPEFVYNHAAYRSTRKTGTPSRLQIDLNYSEEMHWTYHRLILEPDIDPDAPLIRKEVYHTNYSELYAQNVEAMQMAKRVFKANPTDEARYVKGQFAEFRPGKVVSPGYKRDTHLCPDPILPSPGLECFCFCDGWFNPTAVLGQITQHRRLIYIDTVRLEGADIQTLLETQVGPLLAHPKWKDKWRSWRIGGDCTMATPDQGNIGHSAAQDVEKFFARFIPRGSYPPKFEGGPIRWSDLNRTFNYWLVHPDAESRPMILISGTNHLIDKGLNGAWHYKIDNSGNVIGTEPVKDEISHVMDAWANSVYVLLGSDPVQVSRGTMKKYAEKQLRRAQSYATGGGRFYGNQAGNGRL